MCYKKKRVVGRNVLGVCMYKKNRSFENRFPYLRRILFYDVMFNTT